MWIAQRDTGQMMVAVMWRARQSEWDRLPQENRETERGRRESWQIQLGNHSPPV